MKTQILILILVCLFHGTVVFAQSTAKTGKHDTLLVAATYPGGEQEWIAWLSRKVKSQVPVKKGAPAGNYIVIASFVVGKDGKVQDIEIMQDPGYGTAEELIRVLKNAPKWIPATVDGQPVLYKQKQSLLFEVVEEETRKKKG
jgi:protein TonB